MTTMTWNLIQLDGSKILCNLTERDIIQRNGNYQVEFRYDLSDKNPLGRDIIASEDAFADSALFFQLYKILKADSKLEVDKNFLRSTLIFVDFKEIFSNAFEDAWSSVKLPADIPAKGDLLKKEKLPYRMQILFDDGLNLSFDGKNFKRFVPFDKSASMARNCQISFIDSQIKAALDKRLMLDINFIGKKVLLSKFYAYRGLYLSAASRIETDLIFPLNEETVIVLDDYQTILKQVATFSAFKQNNLWNYGTKEKDLDFIFDGEGLISPDFAEHISNFLRRNCNYPSPSHSFQVRMPFTKGVLHEADFNKFFAEHLPDEIGEWLIKDVFGITRDLRKVKIILTKSMFKCASWIKDCLPDPMKNFFEKFAKYEHAIYVANTEARLFNPGRVKLNYQFFSTLDLSHEDFTSLVTDHCKLIDSLPENFATNVSAISDDKNAGDETYDDFEPDDMILRSSAARLICLKASAKNPAFFKDPKVRNIYDGMKKSYECNLGLGGLEVEGEQRFLSRDLLFLLIKILENIEGVKLDDVKKKSLYSACLYQDRFFMPDNKLSIKPDKKYVFLRNPHLSRNEQVLLRAYVKRKSLHEKYFSRLKGVVMISAYSTAAMALGGADFDGDLVKIIPDKRIVQAVKTGNIAKKLPPIKIPSTASESNFLADKIPLQVIVNTFSNKVGLISNWAVKLSDKEYSAALIDEKYNDACAKCTIVVGLEIDAAKTGSHPVENIKEIHDLAISCDENIFLEFKKVIEKILKSHYSPQVKSEKNALLLYLSKNDTKPTLKVPLENAPRSILAHLPECYLRLIAGKSSDSESKLPCEQESSQHFDFELSGWRKTLDESLRCKLAKLIEAYLGVLNLARESQRIENSVREKIFTGHVVNTLKIQYDDHRHQKLSCGIEIELALKQIYAELSLLLKTNTNVKAAIEALKKYKWHLTAEENRSNVAAKILGLNPTDDEKLPPCFELLYNFRCNGYMLFYFVLKDLEHILFNKANSVLETISTEEKFIRLDSNPYWDKFCKIYWDSVSAKKSKVIWHAQLVKICRHHLKEIFDSNMSEALKYYWSQKSKDSSRNFLWNVFDEQEILPHIFTPQK